MKFLNAITLKWMQKLTRNKQWPSYNKLQFKVNQQHFTANLAKKDELNEILICTFAKNMFIGQPISILRTNIDWVSSEIRPVRTHWDTLLCIMSYPKPSERPPLII